jgi:raffinose/stachyose/melibiose transport system permease protein
MRKNIFPISIIVVLCIFFVWPFVFVIVNSLKSTRDFLLNPIALPPTLNFGNYIEAADNMHFLSSLANSLIITILSILLITVLAAMTAWFFVRNKWKLNQIIFFLMVASMIIPFQAIMIPLVKIYGALNMLNSKWSLIYMYIGFGINLAVFMYHGFLKSVPMELEEAAFIDGCSNSQIFFRIVFPMLKSITVTVLILDMLWIWNDFLLPSLVLISAKERTLPLSTFIFMGTYTVKYGHLMAALMMTALPVLIVYLFIQKRIVAGIAQGAIK